MAPIILIKNAFQIHQRYPLLDNMKKIIVLVLLVGLSLESLAQDSIEQALTHESEVLSEIINHYSLSSAINDTSYIGFLYGVTWTMVVPDSNHQYSAYWGRTLDKDQYYQIRYLEDPAYTEMLQSNGLISNDFVRDTTTYDLSYWYLSINTKEHRIDYNYQMKRKTKACLFKKKKEEYLVSSKWLSAMINISATMINYQMSKNKAEYADTIVCYKKKYPGLFKIEE